MVKKAVQVCFSSLVGDQKVLIFDISDFESEESEFDLAQIIRDLKADINVSESPNETSEQIN